MPFPPFTLEHCIVAAENPGVVGRQVGVDLLKGHTVGWGVLQIGNSSKPAWPTPASGAERRPEAAGIQQGTYSSGCKSSPLPSAGLMSVTCNSLSSSSWWGSADPVQTPMLLRIPGSRGLGF